MWNSLTFGKTELFDALFAQPTDIIFFLPTFPYKRLGTRVLQVYNGSGRGSHIV